jgi:hypothetical protein
MEHRTVITDADTANAGDGLDRRRTLGRLRRELHRIGQRDHFPAAEREKARAAVRALGDLVEAQR